MTCTIIPMLHLFSSWQCIYICSSVKYFSLQIYGVNSNTYYNPIISFVEKEQAIKFITVRSIENLHKEIKNSDKAVMVDLYADWCVACKEFEKYTFSDTRYGFGKLYISFSNFPFFSLTLFHRVYFYTCYQQVFMRPFKQINLGKIFSQIHEIKNEF